MPRPLGRAHSWAPSWRLRERRSSPRAEDVYLQSPQAALGVRDSCKRLRAHTGAKKALAGKMGFPGALRCGQQGGPLAPCHSHCIKITSVVLKKKTSP
ncbi:unnamed protein product [Lampetra planeri]